MDVTLGTDVFPLVLGDGTRITIRDITGWLGNPSEVRKEVSERVGAHGDDPSEAYYGPRHMTLHGSVHAVSHDGLHTAELLLGGLFHGGALEMTVTGHGPTMSATVEMESGLRFSAETDRYARWERDIKAPDPRKYGELRVFEADARTSVQVFHNGNARAIPQIEVRGSMTSGFTAWGTGEDAYQVTETVNSGEVFLVDFGTGLLFKNGAVAYGKTGKYTELARVEPYRSRAANVVPATSGGIGVYKVMVRDTWM